MRSVLAMVGAALCLVLPGDLQAQGLQVRLGPVAHFAKRNASFEGTVGSATGTTTGLEIGGRWRHFGLHAQLSGTSFASSTEAQAVGDISNGNVSVLLGLPTISLGVGYGSRSFSGALGSRSWTFGRIGLHSRVPIGATGLVGQVHAIWYVGVENGSGKEAETRLMFEPSRWPIYVGLGYRIEQFNSNGTAGMITEESNGVSLAIGFRYPR